MNYFGVYDPAQPLAAAPPAPEAGATLGPNPATQFVTLTLPAQASARTVQLLDAQGRTVRRLVLPAGASSLLIPLNSLPASVYIVRCDALARRLVVH